MTAGRIEHKPEMVVAGFRGVTSPEKTIGNLWARLYAHAQENSVNLDEFQQLGLILGMPSRNSFEYMAGFVVPTFEVARILGLDAVVIDESDVALVNITGAQPLASMAGIDYLVKDFIPSQAYEKVGPFIEAYAPGDPSSDDYQMQVWVPVRKAS